MKQELFKEMYNNIHLDRGQKDRILDCLEKESCNINTKPQKRFHIPAAAVICACIAMLAAVPVLAATPVLDRIIHAFGLLSINSVELTQEQKNIYSKYGSILDDKVKLNTGTLKLEAVICDKNYMCIPFSLTLADETLADAEDIYNNKIHKKVLAESSSLIFCKNTENLTSMYTILPSEIQDDSTLKGCYLLHTEGAIKQGDTINVSMPDEQDIYKPGRLISKFKINKITQSQNIPLDKKLIKSHGLYPVNNIEISPLSLRIDGSNGSEDSKTEVMPGLFAYDFYDGKDITVELKDGTVVKEADTGSSGSGDSDTRTASITILFEKPVILEDVAGVRIKGKDGNLWFPAEISD